MPELEPSMIIEMKDGDYVSQFKRAWAARQPNDPALLNNDYETTLKRWRRLGVAMETIEDAIDITMHKNSIDLSSKYRYMCGIVWNAVEASGITRNSDGSYPKLYTQEQVDVMLDEEYGMGMDSGIGWCESHHSDKRERA